MKLFLFFIVFFSLNVFAEDYSSKELAKINKAIQTVVTDAFEKSFNEVKFVIG